ncbi:MAG: DNA mismatch repair endonuclease MutL [Thermodesulfovibrionales bacterium]|nr:DNA mismatch repair endonuclease MutL [Thermodesulfovibrionales bacterium]
MPSIHLLPQSLRNKISAGEVIERPASVVKELIENSIDAGATRIDVEILGAGKRLIRISDNGIGMDKEDAVLCIQRYATSKLRHEDDLYNIKYLGFRGEALASISAISRMTIITSQKGSEGIFVEIEGGEIKVIRPVSAIGTTIEVRDLFYNTPARLKFLKTDYTELHHIVDTVTNIAMSMPNIAFNMTVDGSTVLSLSKTSDIKERLTQLFSRDTTDRLLQTHEISSDISLQLFIGDTTLARNNRQNQHIFVNRRWIKDTGLNRVIYNSLETILERGKHPVFFLFLEIPPKMVDFNVHPTKREVRFKDTSTIFKMLSKAVSRIFKSKSLTYDSETNSNKYVNEPYVSASSVKEDVSLYSVFESNQIQEMQTTDIPFIHLFDTILAYRENDQLILIDYHAMHERINYERLLKRQTKSIQLLFPYTVVLDIASYSVILQEKGILNSMGFDIDDFGKPTIIIRAIPDILSNSDIALIVKDMAFCLLNYRHSEDVDPVMFKLKSLSSTIACHESLRGKDKCPDGITLFHLLKQLEETDEPNYCPHGRPTKITITKNEILKMFKKR